jgi:hypothetical protein
MIGPGGLLLVVPHLVVSVSWAGLQESKKELNLDVKNIFAGSHTEHRWRCIIIVSTTLLPQSHRSNGQNQKLIRIQRV